MSAARRSPRRQTRSRARTLLSGFSSKLGSETLNVRVYRDREALVCERELVERDGTSFTMVLPVEGVHSVKELLEADPLYPKVRAETERALGKLDRALRQKHGEDAT